MLKLKPLPDGAREIPGIRLKDIVVGNVKYSTKNPLILTRQLREKYGEIYKVVLPGEGLIFLASQRMAAPVLSQPDVEKVTHAFLLELRSEGGRDGLFTSYNEEPEWAAAHRLLVPAFGAMSIRNMYDQMADVATSMLVRWSAHQDTIVNLPDQLTRLTLDTIALCSFNFRFNSFYKDEMHPFVADMIQFLSSSADRGLNPIFKPFRFDLYLKRKWSRNRMGKFGDKIIQMRKENPGEADDLCARMMNLKDPETGKKLPDKNVEGQLLTFLVAGHETTSGMLSFCLYFMMQNPETMRKAQAEVDAIGTITRDSLTKMPYIEACLKEALRLEPTAPMFGVRSHKETVLADGYILPAGQEVMIDLHGLHRDPTVYPDPDAFKPERMLDFDKLPPHCWKPFGNGVRSCIGRAFAMQESILAIAGIVQNFDLELADPNYKFRTKFTLTIKPDNLMVRVRRRDMNELKLPLPSHLKPDPVYKEDEKTAAAKLTSSHPMTILYGSEAGSCQMLAKEIQVEATSRGFVATIDPMNHCKTIPTDQPVVIVTASYDGQPPANAKAFVARLKEENQDLAGVRYCVFGAGHHEWKDTFQSIPTLVDTLMQKHGATAIVGRGLGDVAGDFVQAFEDWKSELFSALLKDSSITLTDAITSNIKVLPKKAAHSEASIAEVVGSTQLAASTERGKEKRELKVNLEGSYEPGDYLDVFPVNSTESVLEILQHFKMDEDTMISIREGNSTSEVRAFDHLRHRCDYSRPIPRFLLPKLIKSCGCPNDQDRLKGASDIEVYNEMIVGKYITMLDLWREFKSCRISFEEYTDALEPLRSRCYSISSSPVEKDGIRITYDVSGLTTKFMSSLNAGDTITASIRSSLFHLPDQSKPILCFAAGTGIAPFRSFLAHRRETSAKSLLFYGSRTHDDDLYADELKQWSHANSAIQVMNAYSRIPESAYKYVQDLVVAQKDTILQVLGEGGIMYVCGSIDFATSLRGAWDSIATTNPEIMTFTSGETYKVDIFG